MQLNVLVISTFIPFLIMNLILYFPLNSMINTEYYHSFEYLLVFSVFAMTLTYGALFIVFTIILVKLFFGLRETLYFYNMINPYKMLFFFTLTNLYLAIQIWIMIEFLNDYFEGSTSYFGFLISNQSFMELDRHLDMRQAMFMILLHFNPINLVLKYIIITFEDFTQCMIRVNKFINEHNCEFNPIINPEQNNKLRWYCFITNETETEDKAKLIEKFIPTEEEIKKYKMLNEKAEAKHMRKRERARKMNLST